MSSHATRPDVRPEALDHHAARTALAAHTRRTAELIGSMGDPERPVAGLSWTLGETATHLLIAFRGYTDAVRGELGGWSEVIPDTPVYRGRVAGMNSRTIAREPRRDAATLGRLLDEAAAGYLAATVDRWATEPVPTPWYGDGRSIPLAAATCLLLGEQVIHGWDIARTLGRPWPIPRDLALMVLRAPMVMMPIVVNREAAASTRAVYGVHVRGGLRFAVRVHDGTATIEALDSQRIDCHLGAHPRALLLVGYGRMRQERAILQGQLLSWGRRPWLGLGFKALFFDP